MPHPIGTRVVVAIEIRGQAGELLFPRGAVAVIVAHEDAGARLRFPDGYETRLGPDVFERLDDYRRGGGAEPADLRRHIIYQCVVGSRGYGLDDDGSDTDRRGIYLAPPEIESSLYGAPEQIEDAAAQECYWELKKFITLALKANPTVLECLWSPIVEKATPLAQELLAMRGAFLSKLVYQTCNGYVMSQFRKLEADLRNRGEIRWKHAMHLIRLLLQGIATLKTGEVPVRVTELRERLLAIKRGETAWPEVDAWRKELHREFDAAFASTRLPERPDYERANAFLVAARTRRTALRVSSPGSFDPRIEATIKEQPHPFLFVTISGAHLYGFPSPDSDYDLRGVHVLPAAECLGLEPGRETIESMKVRDGLEIDLVTHDAKKFFGLMLKKNGYVLEQLLSPLIVRTTPEHAELNEIAKACLTKHHSHHYLGFAETEWKLFEKEPRVKPLLYIYRVLLTGIHLMRAGVVEANLVALNREYRLAYVDELVARKLAGPEKGSMKGADVPFHRGEYERLVRRLEEEAAKSALPELASARPALNDLLVRVRAG